MPEEREEQFNELCSGVVREPSLMSSSRDGLVRCCGSRKGPGRSTPASMASGRAKKFWEFSLGFNLDPLRSGRIGGGARVPTDFGCVINEEGTVLRELLPNPADTFARTRAASVADPSELGDHAQTHIGKGSSPGQGRAFSGLHALAQDGVNRPYSAL